jgi:hypothetical protein
MKLLTHKKNATGRLMKAVKTMLNKEWHMEIEFYDLMNEDIEEKAICNSDKLPEREDERVAYFPSVYDKKNKDGTLVVFWLTAKHSHVKWRKILEKEKKLQDLKLCIGVHKLSSPETQIIGFIKQKLPEVTHINHYEDLFHSKLAMGAPEIVVQLIYPKTLSGFDAYVKTDVLDIRACKSKAKEADMAMQKLLPPMAEGEYYVSYNGLDEDVKAKTYQHQNWYAKKVKMIQVSGFNNIDCHYQIGLAQQWSFREFMHEQSTSKTKIPIDINNGGYKKRGTKILVLPQYVLAARKSYDEFCTLMKRQSDYDDDMEMMDADDATQVNSKITGYLEQLQAMFDSAKFSELETSVPLMEEKYIHTDSDSSNPTQGKDKKSRENNLKRSKGRKSAKQQHLDCKGA